MRIEPFVAARHHFLSLSAIRRHALASSFILSVLLLSGGATALVAQGGPSTLSLVDAISLAREQNPNFQIQSRQLQSAGWNVRSAYAAFLPSVSASSGLTYTAGGERRLNDVRLSSQPATYSSRYGLGVSLNLDANTFLGLSQAKAQERAVEMRVESGAAALEAEVAQRYFAALEARETVRQAERDLERTAAHVEQAQARFEVGTGTRLEISQAEVQRGQAEIRLLQAQSTARNEVLLLGFALGTLLPEDVELTDTFEAFDPEWVVEDLLDRALRENPALGAARADADAALARLRSARSAYLPSISLSAGVSGFISEAALGTTVLVEEELGDQQASYSSCLDTNQIRASAGLAPRTCTPPADEATIRALIDGRDRFPFDYVRQPFGATLNVSFPIFNGFARERQLADANIARLDAQQQARAQELQLRVDITAALDALATGYRATLLQEQVRAAAEQELLLAEERYRLGLGTSIEVLDAQANLSAAERADIASVYAFQRALITLEGLVGAELPR